MRIDIAVARAAHVSQLSLPIGRRWRPSGTPDQVRGQAPLPRKSAGEGEKLVRARQPISRHEGNEHCVHLDIIGIRSYSALRRDHHFLIVFTGDEVRPK